MAQRADATSSNIVRDGGNRATRGAASPPPRVRPIDRSAATALRRQYRAIGAIRGATTPTVTTAGGTSTSFRAGAPTTTTRGYYYNPYAFGYGPAGRGHFYFDLSYNSYIWHPYSVYRYDTYGSYGYPVGELRLRVHPRDAQVFIDGYYAGRVDDFDGVFQSLRLEEGEYQVEIVLPGYEPLAFNVRIFPGEKTTYEGDLIPGAS